MAVGIIATPMSPTINPVNPEIRNAKAIKMTPMMNRKILSHPGHLQGHKRLGFKG